MPKQLTLGFADAERPTDNSPQMKVRGSEQTATAPLVAEIAEALRPRVLGLICLTRAKPARFASNTVDL